MAEINLVPTEYRERKERWKKVFSKTTFIALFFLILSLLAYGGLLMYSKNLSASLDAIKNEASELEAKRMTDKEDAIATFDTRLEILKDVFANHTYWTNFFSKLEALTTPDSYFSDAKFTLADSMITATLKSKTKTYTTLAQQMLAFQNDLSIDKVVLSDITLSEEGGLDFSMILDFPVKIILPNLESASNKPNK